jgi:hypothetical protein
VKLKRRKESRCDATETLLEPDKMKTDDQQTPKHSEEEMLPLGSKQ